MRGHTSQLCSDVLQAILVAVCAIQMCTSFIADRPVQMKCALVVYKADLNAVRDVSLIT